jgi:hypothetical protein
MKIVFVILATLAVIAFAHAQQQDSKGRTASRSGNMTNERGRTTGTCPKNGYVTCSFSGYCLTHCGEWIGPQLKQPDK